MNPNRKRNIIEGTAPKGPVVYWMQRDQRVNDNWALIHAQEEALKNNAPLYVIFCLTPAFLGAAIRQYGFMIKGLREVESRLNDLNIPFFINLGEPSSVIPGFIKSTKAGLLVTDFNPLKISRLWKENVAKKLDIPFHEVDAHNIVPCWLASPKQEFAAYTFRPKIKKLLDEYIEDFPLLVNMDSSITNMLSNDWDHLLKQLNLNSHPAEVDWIKPGEAAAQAILNNFINDKLINYNSKRNDPNEDVQSNLSPYLHFGHISAQRIVLSVQPMIEHQESQQAFLEELIVRRELSDNFCYYNSSYNSFEGFHDWAKASLNQHRNDKREYIHSKEEFEFAKTNDRLWNAAQMEMVKTGKMHGYMRMYWAKKILEWTKSPEEAMEIAIYLNDKYQLDGRDPNGYTGIAWSIGGVHDRAWGERDVFGKVRYMNFNGAKRKFDVMKYIDKYLPGSSSLSFDF